MKIIYLDQSYCIPADVLKSKAPMLWAAVSADSWHFDITEICNDRNQVGITAALRYLALDELPPHDLMIRVGKEFEFLGTLAPHSSLAQDMVPPTEPYNTDVFIQRMMTTADKDLYFPTGDMVIGDSIIRLDSVPPELDLDAVQRTMFERYSLALQYKHKRRPLTDADNLYSGRVLDVSTKIIGRRILSAYKIRIPAPVNDTDMPTDVINLTLSTDLGQDIRLSVSDDEGCMNIWLGYDEHELSDNTHNHAVLLYTADTEQIWSLFGNKQYDSKIDGLMQIDTRGIDLLQKPSAVMRPTDDGTYESLNDMTDLDDAGNDVVVIVTNNCLMFDKVETKQAQIIDYTEFAWQRIL